MWLDLIVMTVHAGGTISTLLPIDATRMEEIYVHVVEVSTTDFVVSAFVREVHVANSSGFIEPGKNVMTQSVCIHIDYVHLFLLAGDVINSKRRKTTGEAQLK